MARRPSERAIRNSVVVALTALFAFLAVAPAGQASYSIGAEIGLSAFGAPTEGGVPVACSADTSYHMRGYDKNSLQYDVGQGVIMKWNFLAGPDTGAVALQIVSAAGTSGTSEVFTTVAESAIETPIPNMMNTFKTHIVIPADSAAYSLALRVVSGSPDCLYRAAPGNYFGSASKASPAPLVGGSAMYPYDEQLADHQLNVTLDSEADEDGDGFGDETEDGCPAKPQRQDDCIDPEVSLDSAPSYPTTKRTAKFTFSSDEPGGTFECHLEDKEFSPCLSPLKYKHLKPGRHTFTVRAVDANNNTSSGDIWTWSIKKRR
jgi:hypothetical protein